MVRLKEIAEAAGVSVMTVSKALRDKPDLAPATKARIRALADKMVAEEEGAQRGLADKRVAEENHREGAKRALADKRVVEEGAQRTLADKKPTAVNS